MNDEKIYILKIRKGIESMKKKFLLFILVALLTTSLAVPLYLSEEVRAAKKNEISILFTHDIHSHVAEDVTRRNGVKRSIGGFSRIATVKKDMEKKYPGTFLLDGGDFAMGTPFQTIFRTGASEVRMMGQVGFDAITIGNHEFDYRAYGLAKMLRTAVRKKGNNPLPKIVQSNIDWYKTLSNKKTKKEGQRLKRAFDSYGVDDYTIIEKNGKKIAVFGLLGPTAISQAPMNGLKWKDYVKRAKEIVGEIKRNGEADIIVCLSHTGTNSEDPKKSEDEILAKKVPDIDVIVSGHTHTVLKEPLKVGKTVIVSGGAYNRNLGHLVLYKDGKNYRVKSYKLIELNGDIPQDSAIKSRVDLYKEEVDRKFFGKYGLSYDKVLANCPFEFTPVEKIVESRGEQPLANLITDSYIDAIRRKGKSRRLVDVALMPRGMVRDSFGSGPVTAGDVYKVLAIGQGHDGSPGYPLVVIYLTGRELKACAEVDATIAPEFPDAVLYMSGLSYKINNHRLFMNRAVDISLMSKSGKKREIDDDKLYRVAGSLYSCQMLGVVMKKTHGLISIEPKDSKGNIVKNFNKQIVHMKNGRELKEWYALAGYIDRFRNNRIPAYYKTSRGRKAVVDSYNPIEIIKQPNKIAFMLLALLLIPVVIIVGIIIFLVRRRHYRRGYSRSMFAGGRGVYGGRPGSKYKRPNNVRGSLGRTGRKKKF